MKIHRFITDIVLKEGRVTIDDPNLASQIGRVLRLAVGDVVILGDGTGKEGCGQIARLGKNIVEVDVQEISENTNEPTHETVLYVAILRRENFETVVQKATEVGVTEIIPLITARTVKQGFKQDRLEKIIREAAEQSGRGVVPLVHEPLTFQEALAHAQGNAKTFFFDIGDEVTPFDTFAHVEQGRHGLFIGPEGGWSAEESAHAREADLTIASLGPLTLRGETAAIVASYLVVRGDNDKR